jgi:hypothetical protein
MNRTWWKIGVGLPWLGLPLLALRYWMVWAQLPVRLATHFNAANQPNGWMTPQQSLYFICGLYLFLVVLFTVILIVVQKAHAPDAAGWAVMGLFYVVLGVLVYGNESVLAYNLTGAPVQLLPIVLPVLVAIVVVIAVTLGNKRGCTLAAGSVLAEETHTGRPWALVMILPALVELAVIVAVPNAAIRLTLGGVSLILFAAGAMAWSGFQYIFTSTGVEVRTLGYRLRSIPAEHIKQYAAANWSLKGGYGIRGLGGNRAYVWGNRGVRIVTSNGEVFLGHNNPDKIVHDLDAVRQFVH